MGFKKYICIWVGVGTSLNIQYLKAETLLDVKTAYGMLGPCIYCVQQIADF